MTPKLRIWWAATKRTTSQWCRFFGHGNHTDMNRPNYVTVAVGETDGMGCLHLDLQVWCDTCGDVYPIGRTTLDTILFAVEREFLRHPHRRASVIPRYTLSPSTPSSGLKTHDRSPTCPVDPHVMVRVGDTAMPAAAWNWTTVRSYEVYVPLSFREALLDQIRDAIADYPRLHPDVTEALHYDEQIEYAQQIVDSFRSGAVT